MGTIEKRFVADGSARYDARIHRRKGTGMNRFSMVPMKPLSMLW